MARIIDADGHIVEPRILWEQYVEREFRDTDRLSVLVDFEGHVEIGFHIDVSFALHSVERYRHSVFAIPDGCIPIWMVV